MSIAEFYLDNEIDPSDPASYDAWLDGLDDGDSGGGWAYQALRVVASQVASGINECAFNRSGDEADGSGDEAAGQRKRDQPAAKSFGQKWRAVALGRFRVDAVIRPRRSKQWKHFDLFPSEEFKAAVRRHKEAELANPHRSTRERRQTLTFPGMNDKRNWVWYEDKHGVERKPTMKGHDTPDMIQVRVRARVRIRATRVRGTRVRCTRVTILPP